MRWIGKWLGEDVDDDPPIVPDDDQPARKALYIGARVGGIDKNNQHVDAAIGPLARWVSEKCGEFGDRGLAVDLVFDIPGPISGVDYSGMRTGRLSRKKRMLQIQVSVPKDLLVEDVWPYFRQSLEDVALLVKDFAEDHKLGLSTVELEQTIDRVTAGIDRKLSDERGT